MRPPDPLVRKIAVFERAAAAADAAIFISRAGQNGARALLPAISQELRPLEGLLLAVKDNIDVAGFDTTAACPPFAYRPSSSAHVVQRLLAAGASMVGKTNLDQFACGLVGTRSPYGEVPNALSLDHISGGSSSGSAVAVSLGLVDAALGTDTAGSGRIPAAFNNIVGIKPSRGLLSLSGSIPACHHLDCISIFARNVPTALAVLRAAQGYDPLDPFSSARPLDAHFMPPRPRVAIPNAACLEFFGDTAAEAAFRRSLELLASLGAELVDFDIAPMLEAARALYQDAWVAERYNAIAPFFEQHQEQMDPVVRGIIASGKRFSASDLFTSMARLGHYRQASAAMLADVDVLLVPTAPTFPSRAAVRADPVERNRELGYYTNFVNLFDLAAISVPTCFRSDGLPFGVTLISSAGSDLRLADLAERVHRASGLKSGAIMEALPPSLPATGIRAAGSTVRLIAVGAHLDGLPLNWQLQQRGARLVAKTHTAARYRLYRLANSSPPKPGLVRVGADDSGHAIAVEVWEMPMVEFGSFVAGIPAPLGIGVIELADGTSLQGFVCESAGRSADEDISAYGGWRAFLDHLHSQAPPTLSRPL